MADPILSFASAEEFRAWLDKNHDLSGGIWFRLFRAGSGKKSLTYAGALDEALCYGWSLPSPNREKTGNPRAADGSDPWHA